MDQKNIIDLLKAESFLGGIKVQQYVCEEMLTLENYRFYFKLSKLLQLNHLKEYFYNIFLQQYLLKKGEKVFYELSYNDITNLVASSQLKIDSEIEVFNAVTDWIKYKKSEREQFICDLLKLVRLPLLTKELLVDVVQAHPLCSSCFKCKKIILNALKIKENSLICSPKTLLENRHYSNILNNKRVMIIGGKDRTSKTVRNFSCLYEKCGLKMKRCKITSEMKNKRLRCSAFVIGTKVYCFSGGSDYTNERLDLKSLEVYCTQSDCWKSLAPLERAGFVPVFDYFCGCVFMGKIYIFHNPFSKQRYPTCSVYDPGNDRWNKRASLNVARCYASCTVFNGKCVVVGGRRSTKFEEVLKSVEVYDHHLDKWSYLPAKMQMSRLKSGLISKGNKMFVIGGIERNYCLWGDRVTHEVYDCSTKQFTFIANNYFTKQFAYTVSRYNSGRLKCLYTVGDKIFVFDDVFSPDNDGNLKIPTYDVNRNTWFETCIKTSVIENISEYSFVVLQKYLI